MNSFEILQEIFNRIQALELNLNLIGHNNFELFRREFLLSLTFSLIFHSKINYDSTELRTEEIIRLHQTRLLKDLKNYFENVNK